MAGAEVDSHKFLSNVIGGEDPSKTTEMYTNWSESYEKAMADVQYFGPTKLMEYFDKLNVPQGSRILDVCAGTGGIGRELVKRGYTDVHAIDGSEGMLAQAKKEGNYKTYTRFLFTPTSKLPYGDHEFDTILLAGVFAPGHLPIVVMHELVRVTKVGGVIAWICCDPKYYEDKDKQYADGAFYKVVESIKAKGLWKEREGFPISVPYIEYSDGFVMAYDVTGENKQ